MDLTKLISDHELKDMECSDRTIRKAEMRFLRLMGYKRILGDGLVIRKFLSKKEIADILFKNGLSDKENVLKETEKLLNSNDCILYSLNGKDRGLLYCFENHANKNGQVKYSLKPYESLDLMAEIHPYY